jgi:2,5-diamino-6-(ribosylamino)-4(3H)-pyrimidinone 5'-phosphate reductase
MDRPYIIINCAVSIDGKISLSDLRQIKISSEEDFERVYKLRDKCDAILVGIRTILNDNPKLTVKKRYLTQRKQPVRVILDSRCRTPKNSLVVDENAKTLIFTNQKCNKKFRNNVEIINCRRDKDGFLNLNFILNNLSTRGIKSLMVEGGGTVIWNFLRNGFVDDLYVYVGSIIIGGEKTPTLADGVGIKDFKNLIKFKLINFKRLGSGLLTHYQMIK